MNTQLRMFDALDERESARKADLLRNIEAGAGEATKAARALAEIEDRRLWRGESASFEDYLRDRHGIDPQLYRVMRRALLGEDA
jgi:hypothetical protein